LLGLLAATTAAAQETPEHVPPDPPATRVHDMSYAEMTEMMGMDDRKPFGKIMADELEWRDGNPAWDVAAWYGGDFDKLRVESEGEHRDATHSRTELVWEHIVSRWWSTRFGVRHDAGPDSRQWLSMGVVGTAPGFIEVAANVYVGESGRTALRVEADHDLLLTQRLVMRPEFELNAYDNGSSDATLSLRLRYELRREVAPYVGVIRVQRFGKSADLARDAGEDPEELTFVAGLRLWF
jgi:copper resistance protein B